MKYEAERIAKKVRAKARAELTAPPLFSEYAKDFLTDEMLALNRSHVTRYLIPAFGEVRIIDITTLGFEDWPPTLPLAYFTDAA